MWLGLGLQEMQFLFELFLIFQLCLKSIVFTAEAVANESNCSACYRVLCGVLQMQVRQP